MSLSKEQIEQKLAKMTTNGEFSANELINYLEMLLWPEYKLYRDRAQHAASHGTQFESRDGKVCLEWLSIVRAIRIINDADNS